MSKNTIPAKSVCREYTAEGVSLCVRESADGNDTPSREIEGYAIVFDQLSRPLWQDEDFVAVERIAPEAVTMELLDSSDIKLTLFHNRELILGRSNKGKGTLSYGIDEHGVRFRCTMPNTADGDKALDLIRRGDLSGCSFMFTIHPDDPAAVSIERSKAEDGRTVITYTVRSILGIHDFTIAADPAYLQTQVSAREYIDTLRSREKPEPVLSETARRQIEEMQNTAKSKIH